MLPELIRSPLLDLPGLEHGFTHLGTPAKLTAELTAATATCKQVHKAELYWTDRLEKAVVEADAVATTNAGLRVGVYSADCTPILIAALNPQRQAQGVLAIHAGWRGTAQEIAHKSLFSFQALFPGCHFVAAIGPCISFQRFEVGEEVVAAFPGAETRGQAKFLRLEEGKKKFLFDLPGENKRQLELAAQSCGVALQIDLMQHCTLGEPAQFPSFRRDKTNAGRILSFIQRMR